MNKDRFLRMSQAEAKELKDLVEAEMDRRFEAIKAKLENYWTVVVGYEVEQAWSELRELIDKLVRSNLASLDKSLAIVLKVPPAEVPEVPAPPVEILEPVEEKPAEKPSSGRSR